MCRRSGGSPQPPLPPTLLFGLSPELCVGVSRCGPVAWPAPRGSDMEEFDSEDFSSSEEDEDYVPSGKRFLLKRLAPPRDPREARSARRSWARWPVARVSSIPDRSVPVVRGVCVRTSRAVAAGGLTAGAAPCESVGTVARTRPCLRGRWRGPPTPTHACAEMVRPSEFWKVFYSVPRLWPASIASKIDLSAFCPQKGSGWWRVHMMTLFACLQLIRPLLPSQNFLLLIFT